MKKKLKRMEKRIEKLEKKEKKKSPIQVSSEVKPIKSTTLLKLPRNCLIKRL